MKRRQKIRRFAEACEAAMVAHQLQTGASRDEVIKQGRIYMKGEPKKLLRFLLPDWAWLESLGFTVELRWKGCLIEKKSAAEWKRL